MLLKALDLPGREHKPEFLDCYSRFEFEFWPRYNNNNNNYYYSNNNNNNNYYYSNNNNENSNK